ncbi:MAG: 3-oxoadipate enol-lactonase [Betaproteobacteria bacterium]|nr:3-oxoadipate enol-lactonase [Betaproteobacteria bacterium]
MRVETNGIRIHCEVEGDGPWLLMSHSLACDSRMWREQIDVFKGRFRVLAFDTRGHGRSDAPDGAYTLEQLADDLEGLMEAVGVERCHYMGLSMGGMIGMTHALKYPGRFESLILCDTSSRIPAEAAPVWKQRIDMALSQGMGPLVQPTLVRWFTENFRKARPDMMDRVGGLIRETPVAGYVGCCHAIPKIDLTDRLATVQVPTLVVVGDSDAGTPLEMSREIQLALPGAQLAVIPSASHLSNLEQPDVFNFLVGRFLDSVRA